jgi:cell wall-associated NlpC family hydrolase
MLISLFIAFNTGVSSLYKHVCIYVNEPAFIHEQPVDIKKSLKI